jgi:hypothetical protein
LSLEKCHSSSARKIKDDDTQMMEKSSSGAAACGSFTGPMQGLRSRKKPTRTAVQF